MQQKETIQSTVKQWRKRALILPFSQLPLVAQKALIQYMAIDGEAWEFEEINNIDFYVKKYGKNTFGIMDITRKELEDIFILRGKESFYNDGPPYKDLAGWSEWYNKNIQDQNHPAFTSNEIWPVILDSYDDIFQDGWHRLHVYVTKNIPFIPVIFYP